MNKNTILTGVLITETTTFTMTEICQKYSIPQELLQEMIEQGLFNNQTAEPEQMTLNLKALQKMESAFRLHRDLGINLPGVALVLDLLEEMDKMRGELDVLRKHF